MRSKVIIISGGGTGGHLYPALAVGDELRRLDRSLRLIYVGSRRPIEREIMERRGAHFVPLAIEGLKGRGMASLKTLALLPLSLLRSWSLLLGARPRLVIGVGGYSAGPVVLLASLMGIPTLLLEQNMRPGFTNRLLLPCARRAVAAFERSLPSFKGKGVFLGNPVRGEFYRLPAKKPSATFGLLVFGGSQGAHILNRAMVDALPFLAGAKTRLEIVHQTGRADEAWVREAYKRSGFKARAAAYYENMAEMFRRSDLAVCRAGASTIAELIAARRPAILVPLARAADDHQLLNARELERAGAAEVIPESQLTPHLLARKILSFHAHRKRLRNMAESLEPFQTPDAAASIADLCWTLMEESR